MVSLSKIYLNFCMHKRQRLSWSLGMYLTLLGLFESTWTTVRKGGMNFRLILLNLINLNLPKADTTGVV